MSSFVAPSSEDSRPTQILIRGRNGFKAFDGPPSHIPAEIDPTTVSVSPSDIFNGVKKGRMSPVYSPDGSIVCIAPEGQPVIYLYNTASGEEVLEIPAKEVQTVEFSPLGTYIITWTRVSSAPAAEEGAAANNLGNLQIWRAASGELVCSFSQKTYKKDLMQFTADERLCFRSVSNEVHILKGDDLTAGIVTKLIHKGLTQFRASPVSAPATGIAVFNPEAGGKPARITVYTYAHVDGPTPAEVQGPVTSRTVFSANEASMYWNSTGTSLLVHTHSDVDKSNTSYYGSTGLFILTADGTLSEQVSQSKEGPIHDVKWAPGGDRFVVAAGNMPSHTTLYNNKGEPTYEFGAAHRNTISWSPHGRFLVLAGFGNLAGEVDFYDTQRMKKSGSNNAHCSVSWGWSPDSRYFMTATLAPRMNVDNGFKIFRYNGQGPVVNVPLEQAFDAVWRPAASGVYPNRGPSPKRTRPGEDVGGAQAGGATAAAPAVKPGVYRPPGSSGALAEMLRRERAPAGKIKPVGATTSAPAPVSATAAPASNQRRIPGMPPGGPQRTIPGMHPAAAAANAKQGGGQKKSGGGGGAGGADTSGKQSSASKKAAPAPAAASAAEESQPLTAAVVATMNAEAKEKRSKNIKKKLKQIDEIKARKESGATLNADQLNKLSSEESLVKDLALLAV